MDKDDLEAKVQQLKEQGARYGGEWRVTGFEELHGELIRRREERSAMGISLPDEPEPEVCPKCGGLGFVHSPGLHPGDSGFGVALPCQCTSKAHMKRYMEQLPSGSLETFRFTPGTQKALKAARAFAEAKSEQWLIMVGPPGVGKTHLAVSIMRVLAERGLLGTFWVVGELLGWLRMGIGQESNGLEERLQSVMRAPLLVLDDLMAERWSEWVEETLYRIINHRYMYRLPLIVTTNEPLLNLPERVASRLQDVRLAKVVLLEGPDYRLRGEP